MKKLFFVIAVAISLVSCGKDETIEEADYVGNTYVAETGEGIYYFKWTVEFANETQAFSYKTRIASTGDTFVDPMSYSYSFNSSNNIFTLTSKTLPPSSGGGSTTINFMYKPESIIYMDGNTPSSTILYKQ